VAVEAVEAAGRVLVIGGHEDHEGRRRILRAFVDAAGGADATLAVIATASAVPSRTGEAYESEFRSLGAGACQVLRLSDRAAAADPEAVAWLTRATGIFFTGGDQLRITAVLGGTPAERAVREAFVHGAVVAGTSAGASAMSGTMIVGGASEAPARREVVRMAPGLHYLPELVIDQHFAQRGRLNRLLAVLAHNPALLGVGVDEDTAFWVGSDRRLHVLGTNTVTILDGWDVRYTTASEADLDQPLTLTHVTLHVLSDGSGFDLGERRPIVPRAHGTVPADVGKPPAEDRGSDNRHEALGLGKI